MVFERVLLAYDGSPAAVAGLSFARRLARAGGCEVTVAHVLEPGRGSFEGAIADRPPGDAAATSTSLEELCREGFEPGPVASAVIVEDRTPATAIVELAQRGGADLIVVGRSGRHSLGRLLLGSTAERVVRHAPGSVAVFPPEDVSAGSPPRVLVGHDGSDRSAEAVRTAAALAGALSAGLLVVHVVSYRVPFAGTLPEDARGAIRQQGEALLREACAGLSAPLESVETELRSGDPRVELLAAAREHRPVLLVIGARGAGGFPELVLGSTTDAVVCSAQTPVLVVKDGGSG